METLGLKNVNLLSKEQYDGITVPAEDELYAISGSGFGKPSSNYIDLTLGANGASYTAPANGWFTLRKKAGITGNYYLSAILRGGDGSIIAYPYWFDRPTVASENAEFLIPIKKGYKLQIDYTITGSTDMFRFIYDEGEE